MIPKKHVTITLLDETNCIVGGLEPTHFKHFYESYGLKAKNHFFHPKFKLGVWDGKIRFFKQGGQTFIFLLDEIVPVIDKLGYEIDIVDKRVKQNFITPPLIDEKYFYHIIDPESDEPYVLRDYQVSAANAMIGTGSGIVIAGTGSGKTLLNAVLVDSYGKMNYPSITIVPSQDLIDQTIDQFDILDLDVGEYSGTKKDIDHMHVVSTWQSLQNNPIILKQFKVFVVDECHGVRSDVLKKILTEYATHISHRFGLTGTLPQESADAMSVKVSVGKVLFEIPASKLIEEGHLSNLDIDVIQIDENLEEEYDNFLEENKEEFTRNPKKKPTYRQFKDEHYSEYPAEKAALQVGQKHIGRTNWIVKHLMSLRDEKKGNVFCLVDGVSYGKKLAKLIPGAIFVYGKDKKTVRKEIYSLFKDNDNLIVIASIGIASTGLNIKRIFNLVYIDVGKSFIRVIQTIGRGLRKAKDKDYVKVTDISSDLKYGRKHLTQRLKFYNEARYPFKKRTIKLKKEDIIDEK